MMDLVINHVSVSHPWFGNYLSGATPGKDYFIEQDPEVNYTMVVRPRSTPLFTSFHTQGGEKKVWTTFSADQADLNFSNPDVLLEMIRVMLHYVQQGARIIRLDAIAFLWKEKNTTCLHLPQTHAVVKLLRDIADFVRPGTLILTETNVPHRENLSYFGQGDEAHMVYQFTLPPLLLHTLLTGNAEHLTEWAERMPPLQSSQTFLNFTASHDGIGVRPLEGILPAGEIEWLVEMVRQSGGLVSKKNNPDGTTGPYELNITYFDALKTSPTGMDGLQESRFMCSQLIMLALKGIPAVYIQSLLAAPNDLTGFAETGRARSVNRKQWNAKELREQLREETPAGRIFREYLRVLSIRRIPAFHPDSAQQILHTGNSFFALKRGLGDQAVYCISNVTAHAASLLPNTAGLPFTTMDILSSERITGNRVNFKAYQTRWLIPVEGQL
jgi:sucrose phosphorylase